LGSPRQREAYAPESKCFCGTWGTARAAQRGARPREHYSSGIGEHAHCGAEVWGALVHWDVCLLEARAPQRDTRLAYKFKNLNMKMSLKLKINFIWEYLGLIIYPIKQSASLYFHIKSHETIPLKKHFNGLKLFFCCILRRVFHSKNLLFCMECQRFAF
jgi:hypothetical protein